MADRSVLTTSTFNDFRREVNGTARDIGDIADLLGASGFIASSTDVVEAIVAINSELPEIKTDAFIFPGRVMSFEGATDDAFETTLTFAEPTADRTHTLPDADGSILLTDNADTSTNKTFTTPTITSDSGSVAIVMDSETLTIAGGTNFTTSASGNTVTVNLSSSVATLTGSQTLTNKTFTSPTISAHTFSSGTTTAGMSIGANGIVFEGATADAHETTLTVEDPTQDNTITIPDSTMTAITTATHATKATHIARAIALG